MVSSATKASSVNAGEALPNELDEGGCALYSHHLEIQHLNLFSLRRVT